MTCSSRDPVAALDRLDAALGEWRGDAFAEFAETEWIRPEAVRLEELRLVAAEARIDAQLRVGRHHEVVGEVDALRLDHPLREQFARQAMLALYRSGRQAEALRIAQQFRATLRDDLGLEPSADLRDLEAAVLEERADLAWVAARRPRDPRPRRSEARDSAARSRPPRSSGASATWSSPSRLLESGRILTLFGPGGVGKTRLAHRLAGTLADQFADGVRLVELAPVRDEGAVAGCDRRRARRAAAGEPVARRVDRRAAGVAVGAARARQLRARARHHQRAGGAGAAVVPRRAGARHQSRAARHPRRGRVVGAAASRSRPLGSAAGRAPATWPRCSSSSSAPRSAQPDFALDDENHEAVAELCIRLDGVPLALELAAARMRSMSPAQLAERLPERFRVLAGSRRATDPRHRTLRDLVEWSYDLLTPVEQLLFDRLSVFAVRS